METITLNVEKSGLDEAQRLAGATQVTREVVLNQWLERHVGGRARSYSRQLMDRLKHVNSGGKFTREEMNERQ